MPQTLKKIRSSNLELYRIIVMLSIVFHHYVVNSGLAPLMDADSMAPRSLFLYLIGMWGKTGINCFVLITGYFMCKKEITLRKFLKLILEVEFYNVVIYLIFVLTGYTGISLKELFLTIIPVKGINDDFTSCYLIFFLFIPFLNQIVGHITKRQHQYLLMLSLLTYTAPSIIPGIDVEMNYVSWFIVLFFIGSYLRLYPIHRDGDARFWGMMFVGSVLLSMLSVVFFVWLHQRGLPYGAYSMVSDSNAPMAVVTSVCAFMYFKNLKLRQSNFVNILGGGTFGVLLIHAHSGTMRRWLWRDVCDNAGHYASDSIYLHALLIPVIVFAVCSAIEYVRMKTIETPLIDAVEHLIKKTIHRK